MSHPFNYPFAQRDKTMYLSTISKEDFKDRQPYIRESTFLQHDVPGSKPRALVSRYPRETNFSLSTYIEPAPDYKKSIHKTSNPLYIDDIQGARPKASNFRTRRVVDPLCPKYLLPSASQIVMDNGRKFIRDTLKIQDINGKSSYSFHQKIRGQKQPIEGSNPSKLTKQSKAKYRLQVKDINKDGLFESSRRGNPLQPSYNWRDNDSKQLNNNYGQIKGTHPSRNHPQLVKRPNNFCLGIADIQGAKTNSTNSRYLFLDKRRQFKNYMAINDIEKTGASSLKKGISGSRNTNPLMPAYQYLGDPKLPK